MSQQPPNPIKVTAQAGDGKNWATVRTRHLANHPPEEEEINQLKKALKDLVVSLTTTEGEPGVTPKPYLYNTFLSCPFQPQVTKVAWFQNTIRDFSYSKKYVLLHYNVVSRMCFHLYYFYNVSPSKISNHNAFYNFLSGYNALHTLDKMD